MTTGRINQIAIPTDKSKDKSVAMKQTPFVRGLVKSPKDRSCSALCAKENSLE